MPLTTAYPCLSLLVAGIAPPAEVVLAVCAAPAAAGTEDLVLAAVRELALGHREQWAAEDCSRTSTTPVQKAEVKDRIDALNARRAELVGGLDQRFAARVPACTQAVALHTETLGSVIDRLIIAWVRAEHLVGERGSLARGQLRELAGAYDGLLAEVAAGMRRIPGWAPLKAYGAAGGRA